MEKIVIIGSPGAGKTTLAKKLSPMLNIKVYHLDRLFWQRDWKRETRDTRIDILQNLVWEKRWIIEGTYLNSSKLHVKAADTIIFLDIPPLLCLQRLIKRHHEYHGCSRRDIPLGSTDKLTLFLMLKVLAFSLRERRTLEKILREFPPEKAIRLYSAKEVEGLLVQPELNVHANRQSANIPSVLEQSFHINTCFVFLRGFYHFLHSLY